ncbi:ubiquitin-like domain-containing protein CIP73 [Salvia miltiorrhiza]|uniref:ubiquitin-like domain-containing protein CIP73 n=1 Tax=Salvia miltiorrhiza TaxID=226208 RepID=UPI0025AC82FF|nr:ubiquitin-like domain-containing protein CIP73 [Salvia miltiorrhiza]XP_057773817.1 ubiquitin-like domain-containing protein CIP73 [Salvia miltiorrhiza]
MGSNGGEHIKISGRDAAECSQTTVLIKIKTLDSQTFTLRVDKCVPVPELKEQIASVTGVLSEQQRLICRGKVLKDDQLLSAYHVEDGHTLHLVVRQPIATSAEQSDQQATDPTSSTGQNAGGRISPGMVVGTFNISEQGDGAFPDLNRIVSAVLNSFGVTRFGSGAEGIDLNQPPLERLSTASGLSGTRNSSRPQSDQAASVAIPVEPLQPPVIPDSLTTLLQYLSHLRQEFPAYGQSANAQSGRDGQDLESAVHSSETRGLLNPESLAEVMSSARQLLLEQAAECLLQLSGQLESHSSVTDSLERSRIQSNAIRSGALFQNLGALLLELGRAMMTLRMGQSVADALVNAGPSVFISSTGPNPIMVQPLPFQPGASFGSVPVGTVQHGSGVAGSSAATGFLPRNIDIRIRAGSLFPRREPAASPSQGQTGTPSSNSASPSQQQDAATVEPSSRNREPQLRAVPIRTVVAAVPASVGRSADSSRGSIGILYPVLARVQHLSSGSSNNARSSQASDQNHDHNGNTELPVPGSSTQQQHVPVLGGNGSDSLPSEALNDQGFSAQVRGLEQLLSSIFPGGQILSESTELPHSASAPSHAEAAQGTHNSQESASAVSEEGVLLSNILRQIMPMLSENTGAEDNRTSTEGANSDETQVDDNRDQGSSRRRRGSQSQANPKRQRRE